jgi:uncharacterized YccA/Bax inhibitor family protein
MMRTGNPVLHAGAFGSGAQALVGGREGVRGEGMTIMGTVNKTYVLLVLLVLTSAWVWSKAMAQEQVGGYVLGGVIGGFILAMVTVFKKEWAPVTAPLYAAVEGLFIGGISAIFEARFPGIVMQAVALTFGTLFCLLMAYRSGLIKATENFKLGVVAATGGIALVYFVIMILGFFGVAVPFVTGGGPIGIVFSLFVVTIAALNLVLDFDFIEQGAAQGAPKYMEWFGAFGLMVTLVWLYIEILRLLSKLQSRR